MTKTVTLTTFGPNYGKDIILSGYNFIEGKCEVSAEDSISISSILERYYDVCPEHELAEKRAAYEQSIGITPATPPSPSEVAPIAEPVNNPPQEEKAPEEEPAEKTQESEPGEPPQDSTTPPEESAKPSKKNGKSE